MDETRRVLVKLPKEVIELGQSASRDYPDDPDAAILLAVERTMALPYVRDLFTQFVTAAQKEIVYNYRHDCTRRTKHAAGEYDQPAKVGATVKALNATAESIYDTWFIGTKSLGSLLVGELETTALSEEKLASGHLFNAKALRWLYRESHKLGADDAVEVREAVPVERFRKFCRRHRRERAQEFADQFVH